MSHGGSPPAHGGSMSPRKDALDREAEEMRAARESNLAAAIGKGLMKQSNDKLAQMMDYVEEQHANGKFLSLADQVGDVDFPEYAGEKHYMIAAEGGRVPEEIAHWQPTVTQMLKGIIVPDIAYIMIDQSFVEAGQTHRRPGVHVDGYWNVEGSTGWKAPDFRRPELLILAASHFGSFFYTGGYKLSDLGEGGEYNGSVSALNEVYAEPNKVYRATVGTLHCSAPVPRTCYRTLVRINVPSGIIKDKD